MGLRHSAVGLATPRTASYFMGRREVAGYTAEPRISFRRVRGPRQPVTESEVTEQTWKGGWAAGGGVEWGFLPNWSVKVEYMHFSVCPRTS